MKHLIGILFMVVSANAAAAVFNVVVAEKSNITFVSKQMGVAVTGNFSKFTSQINFDPAKPQSAHAQIDVALASINAGSSDANDEVKGKQWFDVKSYPSASFISSAITPLGGNRYQASGKLIIKGKSRAVLVPFNVSRAGSLLVLDGAIPVLRSQYGIGAGEWADPSVVADEVQIRFHLTLKQ